MTKYLIRFDDFFPGMERESFRRIRRIINELTLPAIIGVVPNWEDTISVQTPVAALEFWDGVRAFCSRL